MIIGRPTKFYICIGRDYPWSSRLVIAIGLGYRIDAKINEIPWRYFWSWSPEIPKLIRGEGRKIIGFRAFGRCRIFR